MKSLAVFLVVILCSCGAYAYSSGPPASVCGSLRPGSPHGFALQTGNGGYVISVPSSLPRATTGDGFDYQPGQSYTIRLEKNNAAGENFIGFAFQVVQAGTTTLLGTLAGPGTARRYLSCTGNGMATLTHSRAFSRTSEEFTWTAPTGSAGTVDFRYTVVRTMPVYYFALLASSDNYVVQMAPTTSPPKTDPPVTTSVLTDPPVTTSVLTDPPVTTSVLTDPPVTTSVLTDPPVTTSVLTDPPVTTSVLTDPPVTTSDSTDSLMTTSMITPDIAKPTMATPKNVPMTDPNTVADTQPFTDSTDRISDMSTTMERNNNSVSTLDQNGDLGSHATGIFYQLSFIVAVLCSIAMIAV